MIAPGTQYLTLDKHPIICTVSDVHTTRNLAGEVVRIEYVSKHQFLGQTVTASRVTETAILRGIARLKGESF